jgi:hypothetical protein
MGHEKDLAMQAEEKWNYKARDEDIRCDACGMYISYGDRQSYFDTRMCAHCAAVMAKDD